MDRLKGKKGRRPTQTERTLQWEGEGDKDEGRKGREQVKLSDRRRSEIQEERREEEEGKISIGGKKE